MNARTRLPLARRNPERGAIAFVVAAMWMVLFGLAAFAVDMGYRYQSKFGLQAAADAAVRAGMPSFVNGDTTGATSKAIAMAGANGYPSGQVTVTPSGNLFQVDITATPPSFFLGLFGSPSSFPLGATAIGEKTGSGGGGLLIALNDGGNCPGPKDGIWFNGSGPFNLTGNVQSNGHINASGNFINFLSGGTAQTICAGEPTGWNAGYISAAMLPVAATPFADPYLGTTLAGVAAALGGCTQGDFINPLSVSGWVANTTVVPNRGELPVGVYCSGGNMDITDTSGTNYSYAPGSVFLSVGPIQIGSSNGGTFSAPVGSPHGIFIMTMSNAGTGIGGQAVNLGTGNTYSMQGAVYAPNGMVQWGGNDMDWSNGSIVANEIFLSTSPLHNFNMNVGAGGGGGGGGGGGARWKMHR